MKKALILAPMGSMHRRFNISNIDALLALGYEVELAANFENGEGPESLNQHYVKECAIKGIITHSIPFKRHSLSGSLKCLKQLKQTLRKGKYEIVHTHTETGGLLLKLACDVKGKSKFFYTPHGMSFWKGSSLKSHLIYKPLERWICSGMDVTLGINMEEVEILEKWNKKSATYVHGIGLNSSKLQSPNRTREEVRKEFGVKNEDKFIVSIGELNNNKNHTTVIKALVKMNRMDFKYVVCGVGPNKEMLLEQAAKGGLKDNLILTGFRPDIPDILNAADIFVFPSFHEGMPVSVLEAMACSLPVICSKIRGNVDIIKEGENGYLFEPVDIETLALKLTILFDNKGICINMGKKNLEIVNTFSQEAVTNELKKIYSI